MNHNVLRHLASMEETAIVERPEDIDYHKCSWMSASASQMVAESIVRGIARTIGIHLATTGSDQRTIAAKVCEFLNFALKNNDLSREDYDYYYKCDWYCTKAQFDARRYHMSDIPIYSYYEDLLDTAVMGCKDVRWGNARARAGLTNEERQMFEDLDAAERAYWKARSRIEHHFTIRACLAVREMLTKYSAVLTKIDGPWFEEMDKMNSRRLDRAIVARKEFENRANESEEECDAPAALVAVY